MKTKSQLTSFLLTLFFGPIGLFYTSTPWALALVIVCFISSVTVIFPLLIWVVSIFIGYFEVKTFNRLAQYEN